MRHYVITLFLFLKSTPPTKAAWYDQRCTYRRLCQHKCIEFWSERIEADRADPRKLWSSVNVLLGSGSSPHSSAISAEDFCRSFADKVAGRQDGCSHC